MKNRRNVNSVQTVIHRFGESIFRHERFSLLFRRRGSFLTKLKRNIRRLAAKQFSSETNDE